MDCIVFKTTAPEGTPQGGKSRQFRPNVRVSGCHKPHGFWGGGNPAHRDSAMSRCIIRQRVADLTGLATMNEFLSPTGRIQELLPVGTNKKAWFFKLSSGPP